MLRDGIAIYGGFAGTETLREERDPAANLTVLNGDLYENDNNHIAYDEPTRADNVNHVVSSIGGGNTTILDGFTVSGGNAIVGFNINTAGGGGLWIVEGMPVIRNMIFSENSARDLGGAMFNEGSSRPTMENIVFTNNASERGGGLANSRSYPGLSNVFFIKNLASYAGAGMVNILGSQPVLEYVTFDGNQAFSFGGGMANYDSTPSVSNSTFSSNQAFGNDHPVHTQDRTPPFGGGMYNSNSDVSIVNSTFSSNRTGNGTNSIGGSGIGNQASDPTLIHVTISGNLDGMMNDASYPIVRNSILWGNTYMGEVINIRDVNNSSSTVRDSVIQNGFPTGINIITTDPLLGALDDYGGPTKTISLSPGSSAIDQGNLNDCLPSDQRGVTRPRGLACDIGAYEYEPTIRYVRWNANGANNGTSWTDAYKDLQSALAAAVSGDQIWVGAGTYKPTTGTDRTVTFQLKSGVAIYGGFAGTETLHSQRDYETNLTVLSGDIGATGDRSDNSYHVVFVGGSDNSAVLDGFAITAGNANGEGSAQAGWGGGMLIENDGRPSLVNLTIAENSATRGGGMSMWGSPLLTNVKFANNAATLTGGGIYTYHGSRPSLTNVTFDHNAATHAGGGIYTDEASYLTLRNVTFSHNSAGMGAGLYSSMGVNSLTNTTFHGNTASTTGGAIYNGAYGTLLLTHVTVSGNTAALKGGIYDVSFESSVMIHNSIVYGNAGGEIDGAVDAAFSIVKGGYPGTGNLDVDPLLAPLQDNGGSTQTMALGAGSPAIDAGEGLNCPGTDQRGVIRPHGSACDIGAYEDDRDPVTWIVTNTNNSGPGSLRRRMEEAAPGDIISFAPSLAGQTIRLVSELVIDKLLTIDGSGLATPVAISGDTDNNGTGNVRAFKVNQNVNATLIHLTITKGRNNYGGGVYNCGTLIVIDSTFSDNSVSTDGAGIYNCNRLTVINSVFSGNKAFQDGGGIAAHSTTAVTTIENSTFTDNWAWTDGGAIRGGGTLVVTKSGFFGNSAQSGGGITHVGTLTVEESIFDDNSASFGGAIENAGASTTGNIANTTLSNNSAISGGAITNSGVMTVTNSTFFNNSASTGGGIHNYTYFSLTLMNSTFSNNKATNSGGGIYNQSWGAVNAVNTIMANSTSGGDCVNNGEYGLNINNLVEDGSCFASLQGDPNLAPLADNGGFTQTMALPPGSPAIDAGDDENCAATDQRGITRPQGSHCDIGAYELEPDVTPPAVLSMTRAGDDPTTAASVDFTVTFSEPVRDVDTNDFALDATDSISNAVVSGVTGTGATRTVTVNTGLGNGMLRLDVPVDATINDLTGNPLDSLPFLAGEVYTIRKPASVDVSIHGVPGGTYSILPGTGTRQSYNAINNGPVKIAGTNHIPFIPAERVIYKVNGTPDSFSEMMALPDSQLDTTYWLPWYNNVDLDTQLRFANVSSSNANVTVYINGVAIHTLSGLVPGASTRVSFPGVDSGPVKIVSNVDIVVSERVIYRVNGKNTSFSEMMALPNSQLDTTYWLPWYNNVDLDTQLRFGNVSNTNATIHVYIAGQEMTGSPFILAPGAGLRKSYAGINNGPVKVESDVPVVVAERVVYRVNNIATSFSEMMALSNSQVDTTYWLPWYNNVDLDTQLRFANISNSQPATVHVYIAGQEMNGSPFTLAPGESIRKSFMGISHGPVKVQSDIPIVAAERVLYKVNGIYTSFTELMGLPDNQLNVTYWLPWYNNVDLDTQLRFSVP